MRVPDKPYLLLFSSHDQARAIMAQTFDSEAGYPLLSVHNSEEAKSYLRATNPASSDSSSLKPPRLILLETDFDGDGLEILQHIRAHPQLWLVPVVVLGASNTSAEVSAAYAQGANSYLCKPQTPEALQELSSTLSRYWLRINQAPTSSLSARSGLAASV